MRLMAALNGALERQWRDTHKTPDGSGGGGGVLPEAERVAASTGAQRADAFIDGIIMPVLDKKLLPTSGGAPATVCVTVPLARLQNPATAADHGDVAERLADGSLRLGSATIRATNGVGESFISSLAALELSCDANVQRIVMTPAGKALDIGRKTRVIPEQIRAALILRDGGCIYPMCDKPSAWTHGHHVQHWSRGETRVWTISPCSAPNIITRSTPTTSPSPSIRTANRASRWSAGSKTDPDSAGQVCPEREYPVDQVDDLPGAVRP